MQFLYEIGMFWYPSLKFVFRVYVIIKQDQKKYFFLTVF